MSDHPKRAKTAHPVHPLVADRWSPYVFDGRPVERDKLLTCLEAASWAASSFNEQPWSFLVAEREDKAEFQRLLGCLTESNQAWAQHAGALLLTVVQRSFSRNGKPNRVAEHDVGQAATTLTTQATALGLHVHQMAGVELAKCRTTYNIPEGYDPLTAIAIGYAGDPDKAGDPKLAERDRGPRQRKPLSQFVYTGQFGRSTPWTT
jgi:nitroreductase